ncbi:hypothetical protein FZEAL_10009 [Fusarium zealandicum]|uniref:DUF2293 domain-containing protein n=1 Tax=Fusarium zealandicum TaxID=1053134 RepID=A0A8H4XCY1_9HYPO|nr:hypothetical protein FZEAL_10009 [Fusarium zealandicum]
MGKTPRLRKAVCVPSKDSIPAGYGRLEQGNAYLTLNCRRQATEQKKPYYQWQENGRQVMAFPNDILKPVKKAESSSRARRRRAVQQSDRKLRDEFLAAMQERYPGMPRRERLALAKIQMEKGQNRIARSRTMPMEQRVVVAVKAHAWHVQKNGGDKTQKNLRAWRGAEKDG